MIISKSRINSTLIKFKHIKIITKLIMHSKITFTVLKLNPNIHIILWKCAPKIESKQTFIESYGSVPQRIHIVM